MTDPPLKSITRPRPSRYADVTSPITAADAASEPPAERVMAPKPVGALSTRMTYRGRELTITATGMTLDTFYAAVDGDKDAHLFTIACCASYREQVFAIKFTNMTIDSFCDMLDKRLGVAE